MDQRNREPDDVDMLEWAWLLERLRAASPKRVRAIYRIVRDLVEGQELVAGADPSLILRAERPRKRYRA